MIAIGIAAALGYIIGNSIRHLALAIVACITAALVMACAFTLLPFMVQGASIPGQLLAAAVVEQATPLVFVAGIGLFFGRQRARKGWGG